MFLFYLLPFLPYLLFKVNGSSIAIKLTFVTILQVMIFFVITLLGYSLKNETILEGAYIVGDTIKMLVIINVISIIIFSIIKMVNKRRIKDGI